MHSQEVPMRRSLTVVVLACGLPLTAAAQEPAAAAAAQPAATAPTTATPTAREAAAAPAPAEQPAAAPPPAAPVSPPASPFDFEALVDAYYLYNFTGAPRTQAPTLRAFDTTANNVALNYAKLGVHAETEVAAVRLDVGVGHTAAIVNGLSRGASAASTAAAPADTDSLYGNGFLVQQAIATVKPASFLSIDAGKFMTSAGVETLEANKNWLYSRSLLFYGLPGLYTGLRLNVTPNPRLTLSFQVVNGSNSDPDIDAHKTFGANATYVDAGRGLLAAVTTYVGEEAGPDGDATGLLFDGFFTKETGRLSLGANADYLKRGDAYWLGIAGMGRFLVNELFNLALRAEYLRSRNGAYLLRDASIYEVTAQIAWTMDKHYELRAEVRADMSDEEIFAKGTAPRKNQVTGLLAALAYF
jgi:hypothetical protein